MLDRKEGGQQCTDSSSLVSYDDGKAVAEASSEKVQSIVDANDDKR